MIFALLSSVLDEFILRVIRDEAVSLVPSQHFLMLRVALVHQETMFLDEFTFLLSSLDVLQELSGKGAPLHTFAIDVHMIIVFALFERLFHWERFLLEGPLFGSKQRMRNSFVDKGIVRIYRTWAQLAPGIRSGLFTSGELS